MKAAVPQKKSLVRKIEDALDSPFFRRFMSVAYGLGASIVIIGALFKITHIPGANEALFFGMITEAVIFALSALQKPHVEPDWSKVHPEFLEDYHGIASDEVTPRARTSSGGEANMLDEMLKKANIDEDLIKRLGTGLDKLSGSTEKLNELANVSVANKTFVDNMQSAASSVKNLGQSYDATSKAVNEGLNTANEYSGKLKDASQAVSGLKEMYSKTANSLKDDVDASKKLSESLRSVSESAGKLSESYYKSAQSVAGNIEQLKKSTDKNTAFNEELGKLSKNLSSLNALYELQLKHSSQQTEAGEKLQKSMQGYMNHMESTAGKTMEYQKQMDQLAQKLQSLNKVYGNMLSAMSVK